MGDLVVGLTLLFFGMFLWGFKLGCDYGRQEKGRSAGGPDSYGETATKERQICREKQEADQTRSTSM